MDKPYWTGTGVSQVGGLRLEEWQPKLWNSSVMAYIIEGSNDSLRTQVVLTCRRKSHPPGGLYEEIEVPRVSVSP